MISFVEFCEETTGKSFLEWQKKFLEKAYSVYKETGSPFVFKPRRKNGHILTETATIILLLKYIEREKEENDKIFE